MKVIYTVLILFFCNLTTVLSQGRGDMIFDETYVHEIRIHSGLDLNELFNLFLDELGVDEYTYSLAEVEIDNILLDSVGVRVKGGLTAFDQKKPLKLDFNSFISGNRFDGLKKINLHQGNMDPSYIREAVTYSLFRNAGVKAVRTSFANVYYNDEYQGVYTIVEQIDDNFIKDRFASKNGALYKPGFISSDLKYAYTNPLPYEDFITTVNQIPTELLHEELDQYLDVESYLRFFALEVFVNAVDGPLTVDGNFYIYYEPKSEQYVYIPWDYNLSLYPGANHPLFAQSQNFLLNRALSNPELRQQYLEIFCDLFQYNFVEDKIHSQIETYRSLLSEHIPNDPFLNFIGNWNNGMDDIKSLITSRIESLSSTLSTQINPCQPLINPIQNKELVINEIVASNDVNSGITDPAGSYADWIELYNNAPFDISLNEFYLSNDKEVLKHWRFPEETVISANDYLIIWADRDIEEEGLHADFKLKKERGELYLSYENGDIVDEVIFNNQETNAGFARIPNGSGDFQRQTSTFNASNDLVSSIGKEIENLDWNIFPNPSRQGNAITLFVSDPSTSQLEIIGMDGKTHWKMKLNIQKGYNTLPLEIQNLQPGAYILKKTDESTRISQSKMILIGF